MKHIAARSAFPGGLAAALLTLAGLAQAQFDPARELVEPESIARQFPEPTSPFTTPAFAPGRQDFTTHAEAFVFLDVLARRSGRVAIETLGRSQHGRAMVAVVLTGPRGFDAQLPTVMLLAQQHGNEPAGGEAALVLAQSLATERSALLDRVNVVILPRANPDAAERFGRESASGIDINRDHLLVRAPEVQAITTAVLRHAPQVVLDLHEFTVAGRWVSKFGALMRADALLQAATVGNLSPAVQAAQGRYLAAARTALKGAGHRADDYHTSSTVAASPAQALWEVEDYVVDAEAAGQRQDARGAIADSQNSIRVLRVQARPGRLAPAPGSFYVTMNQPLAALVSAALEPDSQNSLAANRLLAIDAGQLLRVVQLPPAGATAQPGP